MAGSCSRPAGKDGFQPFHLLIGMDYRQWRSHITKPPSRAHTSIIGWQVDMSHGPHESSEEYLRFRPRSAGPTAVKQQRLVN
jgi:hypothetical protein